MESYSTLAARKSLKFAPSTPPQVCHKHSWGYSFPLKISLFRDTVEGMEKEIPKTYTAADWETKLYTQWEESGFFNPDNLVKKGIITDKAESFSVLMPPPNVTGILHLGHAMENSIMDTIVRYKRMRGYRTLFLPGTDHAAVATQARVEKNLVAQGIANPRQELGREKLLKEIRTFSEASKATIIKQIASLGASCDWSRLVYTFDAERSQTVNRVFKKMFDDGLIYKGYRVVNWSVKGQSTCSDDELVHVEKNTTLYTFRYSKDFPIAIATTRPETKLGDTAVAVNPNDERYRQYIGQSFTVDVGAKEPHTIQIIADENVSPEFGTGAVGVTPAHSQIDFEMYTRNKTIGLIPVIDTNGTMNDNAGKKYAGLTVLEARATFVAWLRENSLLEKEEEISHNVGTSDRFGDVVEALPLDQWFVNVNQEIPGRGKSLKDLMREAVTTGHRGDTTQKVSIQPERFQRIYLHWIDSLRDWCISRQIWWGHRIPVWYRGTEVYCGTEAPSGDGWEQDPDTLDTWFSSGMWSFSTLGGPDETEDMHTFHPTSFMQMGHEILFFWMARMILMTTYTLDTIPFREVYIHGMVLDKDGRKFSKSLGNGIDPLEVSARYGTDALRVALLSDITPGNDSRFSMDKVEGARNLVNKLWNITRYILTSSEESSSYESRSQADQWILTRLSETTSDVTKLFEGYQFSLALEKLRAFTWSEFADWYVEIHKIEKNDGVLRHVIGTLLRLWHPFMPFVTEALFQTLSPNEKTPLMVAPWPKTNTQAEADTSFQTIVDLIQRIRNVRAVYHVDPGEKPWLTIVGKKTDWEPSLPLIERLARIEEVIITEDQTQPAETARIISGDTSVFIHLTGLIDLDKERARLTQELESAKKYKVGIEKRLGDTNFVSRAPARILEQNQVSLAETGKKIEELSKYLSGLAL